MLRLRFSFVLLVGFLYVSFAHGQVDEQQQQIVRALVTATSDDDSSVRKAAFATLGRMGVQSMEVVAALQQGLKDADDVVRLTALETFLKVVKNPDEKARVLIGMLDDDAEPRVDEFGDVVPGSSQTARRYLKNIGAPAVPQLIEALKDEQKKVSVLQILKQIGPDAGKAAPAVVTMLKNDEAKTRKKAIDALASLGGDATKVVPQLTELLSDDDAEVRRSVIACLTQYGSDSKEALPKLLELIDDSDAMVRKKVVICLGAISRNSQRPPGMDRDLWNYARRMFREMDADKDGQVKSAEARDYGIDVKQYDTDRDRMITLEEFAAGMHKEQNTPDAPFSEIIDLFRSP